MEGTVCIMKILDTTIRDGSYKVDFKFTCADVKNVVSKLVKLGVEYIEIGHGLGLNASSPERGVSLCTDNEYINAAKEVSGNAKIGMFCIPGIAKIEDISIAKEQGLSFIRIGVTVSQAEIAIPYIIEAKKVGLIVMVNFMKSYIYEPKIFAKKVKMISGYGVDAVYIVDSAGCMMPQNILAYREAVENIHTDIKLGFHGHNNLGMAVANSLYCVELGFDFVDCTFQGIGRSLGNTSTEMFVMALQKKYGNKYLDMDIPKLLEYGYVSLKNIPNIHVQNPLDLICGYTEFHSSYLKDIYKCCCEKNIDPLRLIIAYSKENKESLDYNRLCQVADNLPDDNFEDHPYSFRQYFSTIYND